MKLCDFGQRSFPPRVRGNTCCQESVVLTKWHYLIILSIVMTHLALIGWKIKPVCPNVFVRVHWKRWVQLELTPQIKSSLNMPQCFLMDFWDTHSSSCMERVNTSIYREPWEKARVFLSWGRGSELVWIGLLCYLCLFWSLPVLSFQVNWKFKAIQLGLSLV